MTEQGLDQASFKTQIADQIAHSLQLGYLSRFKSIKKAKELIKKALELSVEHNLPTKQILSHIELSQIYYSEGKYGDWKKHIDKAKEITLPQRDNEVYAWLKVVEGKRFFIEGAIEEALDTFLQLQSILDQSTSFSHIHLRSHVGFHAYLGLSWLKAHNPKAALASFYKGQDFYLANLHEYQKYQVRWPMYYSCYAHIALKEYAAAKKAVQIEIDAAQKDGFTFSTALAHLLNAEISLAEEDWTGALEKLEWLHLEFKAKDYYNPAHELYRVQFAAKALRNLGRLEEARQNIQAAQALHNQIKSPLVEEELILELGLIHSEMGEYETASDYLHQVQAMIDGHKNEKTQVKVYRAFSQIYQGLKEFETSLKYTNLAQKIERKLWENSESLALIAVEREHKYAQQLKDAKIYRLTNIELAKKNQELALLSSQKDILLQERNALSRAIIHDLRNPLNIILLNTELLNIESLALDDENTNLTQINASTQRIQQAADQMITLIDRLVSDKIDKNSFKLKPRWFDINYVITEAIMLVSHLAQKKLISITNNINFSSFELYTDPLFLQQILINLLSNAIKFSPEESNITIRADKNGSTVEIHIDDEGYGLTDEDKIDLFEQYKPLNAKHHSSEMSIGLGLHIAQKLVHMLSGQLEASSEGRNKGSVFTVTLPLEPPDQGSVSAQSD